MLESIIMQTSPKPKANYLVDINFEKHAIGSLDIIDYGETGMVFTRQTSNLNGSPGVIDTQWGKCFQTNGSVNYLCTNGKLFGLISATQDREMTIEFILRNTDPTGYRHIASTGDYPASMQIQSGWIFLSEFSGNFAQVFVTNSTGTYNRAVVTGDNGRINNVVRKYVFQYKASTNQYRLIDVTYNRFGSWLPRLSTVESYARLFMTHGSPAMASGLFKSLTIGDTLTI